MRRAKSVPGCLAEQVVRARDSLEAAVAMKDVEIARVLLVNGAGMERRSGIACDAQPMATR